jgi:hypothetical protein
MLVSDALCAAGSRRSARSGGSSGGGGGFLGLLAEATVPGPHMPRGLLIAHMALLSPLSEVTHTHTRAHTPMHSLDLSFTLSHAHAHFSRGPRCSRRSSGSRSSLRSHLLVSMHFFSGTTHHRQPCFPSQSFSRRVRWARASACRSRSSTSVHTQSASVWRGTSHRTQSSRSRLPSVSRRSRARDGNAG